MTENDRVKMVRKSPEISLSMEKFGQRLGVGKSTISSIESGTNAITSQMRRSICREFHVSETWLETGEGEMFDKDEDFSLDQFLKDHDADQLEVQIVKAYFELPADMRRQLIASFKENLAREQSSSIGPLDDIDATTEEVRQQLIAEKKARAESSASSTDGRQGDQGNDITA